MFHDISLLGRCFLGFVLPILGYCSAVWCLTANTHLKLLDRVVSGAWFLTGGVFECGIAHRRSMAILRMLYKIRCNPVHPLHGALPGLYVLVRVACSALVANRFTYTLPCCRNSQSCRTFIPLSVSLWNDLANPVFNGVGLVGFKSRANVFLLPKLLYQYYLIELPIFPFLFLSIGWYCGALVFGLIGSILLSLSVALPIFFNNNSYP